MTSRFRTRSTALAACAVLTLGSGAALATAEETSTRTQSSSADDSNSLRLGSTGSAVRAVQRKLRVSATGYFGRQTEAAVKRFQRRRGLEADGIVGAATARALGVRLGKASYASGGAAAGSNGSNTSRSKRVRLPSVLVRIAECESGGNPRAVSRDGRYRGKFQFDLATWRSLGGKGDPAQASEALQDRLALKLYRARGTAPWANCA
ncbi:MAG TPA: transglycosylase family protein [Thermoleophilaceae bacterium]|jgi:peptidoglycan hydrolase-like protein with peptidoglycan-binding domain